MTLDEWAKHVAKSRPVVWIDGVPWRMVRRILEPLAMPHTMRPVDRSKVRRAMRQTGAALARWSDAWDTAPCDWWWVCCDDRDYDLSKLSRKRRKTIRKAGRRVQVRVVDSMWFAKNGYEVYAAAYKRYARGVVPATREEFTQGAIYAAGYGGRETWGAFVGHRLIAYMSCLVVDDAVLISSNKWDPEYRHASPNDALEYALTRHYMVELGMSYVTSGARMVYHETSTQSFDEKLGYRRVYCPLRVQLSVLAAAAVRSGVGRWGKYLGLGRLAPGAMAKLRAAGLLVQIAHSCRSVAPEAN